MSESALHAKTLQDYLLLPHGIHANIYIRELARAYQALGLHVVLGADNFAELSGAPRWLHLHWPEEHYRWTGQGSVQSRAEAFMAKLVWLKSKGTRIAWTVHNLEPHEHAGNSIDQAVYETVLACTDLVVHHCDCSVQKLQERYPAASGGRHAVYPHGHFMGYPQGRTRAEARRRLGLKAESTVFLQFGQIRAYKGFGLMLNAFRDLKIPGKQLVVAGRYSAPPGGPSITDRVRLLWLEHVSPRVSMHLREIANDEVQDYMAAADVLVLTHLAGLNSGVAVLGMSFGIPIVAPDLGCIPEVLGQGSNCIYPAGDSAALGKALLKATQIDAAQAWSRNRAAAASWTWDNIAHSVMAHLRSVA